MHNCIRILVKPGCACIVLATHNLFAKGIQRFNKAIVPDINLVRMAFIAMVSVHLVAMLELPGFIHTGIRINNKAATNQREQ
jgi:hypothetical protein